MNVDLIKRTFAAFGEDKATRLASAIAYSTIFSLAPLFIVLIAILGFFIGVQHGGHGHQLAEETLLAPIEHTVGRETAEALRDMISASFNKPRTNMFAQIVGWVTFVLGASALFSSLQDALNAVWHIEQTKGGWKQILRERLASFGMLAVIGFMLLVSLLGTLAVSTVGTGLLGAVPILRNPIVAATIGQIFTLLFVTIVFSVIFKILPGVKLAWRDVAAGAFVTALLFLLGEAAVGLYLRWSGAHSAYGAAGSILVGLLWIYYTALILLLGAEYTKVNTTNAVTTAPCVIRRYKEIEAGVDPRINDETA